MVDIGGAGRIWSDVLRRAGLRGLYKLRSGGALVDEGWFRSVRENAAVDRDGAPIPWIAYPAQHFLERRLRRDFRIFEYGAGNSTIWWAGKVREVVSVEHDEGWYQVLAAKVPGNVRLQLEPIDGHRYAGAIDEAGPFDIVVVDGRDRVECARRAIRELADGGVIVFDNSERGKYAGALSELTRAGFRRIEFVGMAPMRARLTETSVFYRGGNCLGI